MQTVAGFFILLCGFPGLCLVSKYIAQRSAFKQVYENKEERIMLMSHNRFTHLTKNICFAYLLSLRPSESDHYHKQSTKLQRKHCCSEPMVDHELLAICHLVQVTSRLMFSNLGVELRVVNGGITAKLDAKRSQNCGTSIESIESKSCR